MRINRIELQNFRAFPGPATYEFLLNGRNLLLYGENGSGKSSLVRALSEHFSLEAGAQPFAAFENVFAQSVSPGGFVRVTYDNGASSEWRADKRPSSVFANDVSRRKAILDYRALLRTNYGGKGLEERLFELIVSVLLANAEIPTPAGVYPIGELWRQLLDKRAKPRTPKNLLELGSSINHLNTGIKIVLKRIEDRVAEILSYFVGHELQVKLIFPGITYDKETKRLCDCAVNIDITFRGARLIAWTDFLNEARLTALALAIYLGATLERNPLSPPQTPDPLQLLILDDVLIGLDMANRLPVLAILKSALFADYQVILSTYDLAWYELACTRLDRWRHIEMFAVRVGNHIQPVINDGEDHLYLALQFLDQGHIRAAAVHARVKFELLLKYACESLRLKVVYRQTPRQLKAADLWNALSGAEKKPVVTHCYIETRPGSYKLIEYKPHKQSVLSPELRDRIDHALRWVLNPLSHSEPIEPYRSEVEDAVFALDELERAINLAVGGDMDVSQLLKYRTELVRLLHAKVKRMKPDSKPLADGRA